jgi:peptide chain release factor 1
MDRLADVEANYEELNRQIADPAVLSDREKYAKLARDHAEARVRVERFHQYAALRRRVDEAKALASDPEMGELAREDLAEVQAALPGVEKQLKELLAPTDPLDAKNAILEIRAGTGGDEAALFAAELYRMYTRYAELQGWIVEELSANTTGIGGIKEIIALVKGRSVYGRLKYESGTHRVQRVPLTEAGGRIHTSAVTVAVLPEADDIDVAIDPDDLRVDVFRAGGAGGQHVNKTESAVRVTHLPTGLVVSCQDEKSQHKNRARAMKILQARLFEMMQGAADRERSRERKLLVGSGDRSERIRTYNYPQGRVTDHRINLTLYRLLEILDGDIDSLVEPLLSHAQAEALAASDA